mmetsp:Transcript_43/g.85  ORF Transcript_43/g.85 Transcript_43/m.85 type:complete len:83 (+) Transcript_43:436-684(+)
MLKADATPLSNTAATRSTADVSRNLGTMRHADSSFDKFVGASREATLLFLGTMFVTNTALLNNASAIGKATIVFLPRLCSMA